MLTIRFPLPDFTYFSYRSLLLDNNIPMLLGFNLQRKLHCVTNKHENAPIVLFQNVGVTLSLSYLDGHLYYTGPQYGSFLFSTMELAQINRNLGYAPAEAVFSVLKLAYSIETEVSDLHKLQDITQSCKGCLLYSKQPNRCRAVLPDRCIFNFDVAIDVMYIQNHPVLHIVCRQTHFSIAALLPRMDSFTIWTVFMQTWVIPYLGVPFNLWVDQAKSFLSVQFTALANALGCNLIPIPVEAHWSLIAEHYHDPLRRITQKVLLGYPQAPLSLVIDYVNLSMSHTVGPEGFTQSIFAFGAQARLPISNYEQQPQTSTNRMDFMQISRREYEPIVAKLRIRRALHSASPNKTAIDLTPGSEVLVYREKDVWK